MIDIRGGNYFTVTTMTEWDSTLNGNTGGNKLVVDIQPANALIQMQADITSLRVDLARLQTEKDAEIMLRNANPSLKDLHKKYMSVYKLVKTMEGNDGSG